MKAFFKTHSGFFSVISLLTLILFFNLVKSSYVFGGAEEGIPFYNTERTIEVYSRVWVDQIPGFPLTFEVGKIPFLYLVLLIESITGSQIVVSSFFVSFIFIASATSMYFLAWEVLPVKTNSRQLTASISSLFYVLNPFALSQVWGRHLSMQLYPLLLTPLMLLFVVLGLKTKKYAYAIYASLASAFFAGAYNHPSYAVSIISACAVAIFIYYLYNKREFSFLVKFTSILATTFLLLNSFWVLPYYSQIKIPSDFAEKSENRDIVLGLSKFFPLQSIATLKQKFYFEQVEPFKTYYSDTIVKTIGITIPLLTILGLVKFKKIGKKFRYLFLFLFVTTFFISAGANKPFGPLILFAMDRLPFLDLFRNTFEKTGILLTTTYSVFFAIGVVTLIDRLRKFKGFAIVTIFAAYFFIYSIPFWNLNVFTSNNTDNSPPEYVGDFVNWSKNHNNQRIMFLPILDGDSTSNSWDNGYYNGVDITPFIVDKSMTRHLPQLGDDNFFARQFTKKMFRDDVSNLLDTLGIKYIVAREDLETSVINSSQKDRLLKAAITPAGNKIEVCRPNTKLAENTFKDCPVGDTKADQYEFLEIELETNLPVKMEFRILEETGRRSRWDGKADTDYLAKAGKNKFILPFGTETELPGNFDYSKAKTIEVGYINAQKNDNAAVVVNSISLINGLNKPIANIKKLQSFGKYALYERSGNNFEPITLVEKIVRVADESEIVNSDYKYNSKQAYVTEFEEKKFDANQVTNFNVNNGFYSITTKVDAPLAIRLNTFYNKGWSVSSSNSDNPIQLLKSKTSEATHIKADGFANMWITNGGTSFTFYYEPALYFKIGQNISVISVAAIFVAMIGVKILKKRSVRIKNN